MDGDIATANSSGVPSERIASHQMTMPIPISCLPEIRWPAVPTPKAAGILALLLQLEQSQWWAADELIAHQRQQLAHLLDHAFRTVPFYRERLAGWQDNFFELTAPSNWQQLPPLTRRDIQAAGGTLQSNRVPAGHGALGQTLTGGSTGQPVAVTTTQLTHLIWRTLTIRDHLWHGRDFAGRFAAIRHADYASARPPAGAQFADWGDALEGVFQTGPGFLLSAKSSIEEQADWLRRVDPHYVLGYPSALREIAQLFIANGWQLPHLKQVTTFGEVLEPQCVESLTRAFSQPIVDMYSSQEVGCIALQCPLHPHFHVQSESLLVEVVDSLGRPCPPGQVGRVVITALHNFAMPLIRYELGDFAEVGPPCDCGRGLPVLKRILGRVRNVFVLPDGRQVWPAIELSNEEIESGPPIQQFQLIQRSLAQLELLVVTPRDLTSPERQTVHRWIDRAFGSCFTLKITRVPEIPRSASGKYEEFRCEVTTLGG